MTFRVRPVDRGRSSRDPSRRTAYTNLAFALVIVLAVLIFVGVGATTWYNTHLAAAATVNGQTITKDDFLDRAKVEQFRLQQAAARIAADAQAGRLTAAQAQARTGAISNQLDDSNGGFSTTVLEKLIDTRIQAKLAADAGITITPEQVDQRILEDKTRKEERHVWLIAVKPEVDSGKTEPSPAQKAAAKGKADDALAQVKSGKAFEDVAKAVSTDASKVSGGDVGWIDDTASEDDAWKTAVFKLDVNGVTDVVEGADGTFRIGRVSEIAAAQVDSAWDQKLSDAKISQASYRAAITSEAVRAALGDQVEAAANASQAERQVQELYIKAADPAPGEGAIKVRHILYSPKDDPQNADSVAEDDPSWTQAQLAAQAAYEKLQKDPSQFDAIARAESDEDSAKGDDGTGGKLPYFDKTSQIDQAFKDQILKPDLQPGQLLAPFKSAFGWHVVQVMYRPPDIDEMNKLREQAVGGTKWDDLVRDFSEGPAQTKAGDLGWVRLGTIDDRLAQVILQTPKGQFTTVIDAKGDGLYLFKVLDERSQAPDETEAATIKASAFTNWYKGKKADVTITRDLLGG